MLNTMIFQWGHCEECSFATCLAVDHGLIKDIGGHDYFDSLCTLGHSTGGFCKVMISRATHLSTFFFSRHTSLFQY
ncbi:hypothetical protein HanIR_Chr17g0876351 [Helianthus annuus]|nr:hypothetical protein HanIR_Chr17g0876351 [Helianthus annuus]